MNYYAYEARNMSGELVNGIVEAPSVEQASVHLSQQELYVTRLAIKDNEANQAPSRQKGRATRHQVAWFMSQLAVMVEAGISFGEALHCVTRQVSDARFRALLEKVSKSVDEGKTFSEALAAHPGSFPQTLTTLIRASELNGSLSEVLKRSSTYLLSDIQTIRRVRGALIYPVFMLMLSVAVTVVLLTFILPKFTAIFASRGAVLPAPTRFLMAVSENLVANWVEWIFGGFIIATVITFALQSYSGRRVRDSILLSTPLIANVLHGLIQCRTFRTVAVLLNAGVPLMDVISIARDITSNTRYKNLWNDVERNVRDGSRLATPLMQSSLIPESIAQMIEAGERSGRLGYVLGEVSTFIEEEYNQTLKSAMQMIEPLMILLIGAVVGAIALALMLPLFEASRLAGS